jgi:hypothetical protein
MTSGDAYTDIYLGQDSVSTEANQEREYKILKFRPITEKLNLGENQSE